MKRKKKPGKRGKKFVIRLFFVIVSANILIFVTGKNYLYKGVWETYLKGKTGPEIYDSLVFPNRVAFHAVSPEKWKVRTPLLTLSRAEEKVLEDIKTTSFLIVKNKEIIVEKYFENHTENTKSNSFSMAKSFIGLMMGIAIDEGKIEHFDSPVSHYLPFHLGNQEEITIRELLGMSSGLNWSESGSNPLSDNAEAYYTSDLTAMMKKKSFGPNNGNVFHYASGNSQLLGMILQNATGKTPTDYFEEKIWSEMGTENDFLWSLDHENGVEKTFCCGYATTRDYAKIGQLILNNGKWNGKTIIAENTLKELISPYSEFQPFYGLHFWIFPHPKYPAIYLRGILGQYIVVIPSLDVVLVRTGHERKSVYSSHLLPEEDAEFLRENQYKENHPEDLSDYFLILESVLERK